MKHPAHAQSIAEKLKTILEAHREVKLAYLYGSHAYGKPTPLSDLDIALLTGYIPALWPLTTDYLWLKVSLDLHIASLPTLKPAIELLWKPTSELTTYFEKLEVSAITGEG